MIFLIPRPPRSCYTFCMRNELKSYVLKEYGAWSVLVISCLIGLGVSRAFSWQALLVCLSLGLLINSKPAFTKWIRGKDDREALLVFLGQIVLAAAILLALFSGDLPFLLPLLVFPVAYLVMNKFVGEHFLVTELLGFVLLSLAAVIVKFQLTGGLDVRLLVAVALYFMAGVFKVKTLLLKKTRDRILMALYLAFAAYAYRRFHISLLILLPLTDNLIVVALPYKVKLQTTGWIEVAKSLLFLGLMVLYF